MFSVSVVIFRASSLLVVVCVFLSLFFSVDCPSESPYPSFFRAAKWKRLLISYPSLPATYLSRWLRAYNLGLMLFCSNNKYIYMHYAGRCVHKSASGVECRRKKERKRMREEEAAHARRENRENRFVCSVPAFYHWNEMMRASAAATCVACACVRENVNESVAEE